ncbi:GDSL-type esterase/lipase family protein [Flavobacterium sp. BFFFF1]|uniref:GDSL-type esterase/lipase family protein n=1 Tax=Flavobacterium sp. BFFFF1 TaxID=2015557 RepID=UPI0025C519F5|nr:GDSL-type esterase/lipase family protein [Flavobacterium sp. BFFFF1]
MSIQSTASLLITQILTMKNKLLLLVFFLFALPQMRGQVADSTLVETDSVEVDTIPIIIPENGIQNPMAIASFLEKLYKLDKSHTGKINIVHIGDSHIQADLITNRVRESLQEAFGNGGRGLIFPHSLARTNGSWDVRFSSNERWESYRIVSPVNGSRVGLSGIALTSKSDDFAVEINAKEESNFFNTIKIITPNNSNSFNIATAKRTITLESNVPKSITHKIKNGEALSIIADKYNVSISQLKRANGLRSDRIRAGKTLKIPTDEMQKKRVERSEFIPLPLLADNDTHFYITQEKLEKIYLLPGKNQDSYTLNGIVLENNDPGIVYHNIGVNGAKLSDYNKYPMFFEQLKALQPDLIIVALGTNESFDKMRSEDYMKQLELFMQNVRAQETGADILVATPSPSMFKRKIPNVYVADYAQKILNVATDDNYAVWDMYAQLGGLYGVSRNYRQGLMAGDRVHYSKAGYEKQGDLLTEAILGTFSNYKKTKQ